MKTEAVIFDWAGTTVDFGSFAPVYAFIEAFKEFGITPTFVEVREPMGMLKWDHIHTMMKMPRITEEWKKAQGRTWTENDVNAVYEKSEQAVMSVLKDFAAPKPFVPETVSKLRERGIRIGSTTGYTDEMMEIVVPEAKRLGYSPDTWFSPNSVNNLGRPYPYMIFRNLEALRVSNVKNAIKVGDTVSDIREGKNAGLISVGVIVGSSVMGLSETEWNALTQEQKNAEILRVSKIYKDSGADYVINNISEICDIIDGLEESNQPNNG